VKGLVHRYPDRVLIKLIAVCAVYCRFCFRRERVGPGAGVLSAGDFAAALDYVRCHRGIWEVILTGGDPLALSPRRIAQTTEAIAAIDHVKTIRWHTRMPVAAPDRVTRTMARALMAEGKTTVVAVHANHPRELTEGARAACRRLANEGAMLVSQTVLLEGVNDDVETLAALMRAFVEARVKPYYLHHGDLAPGTAHWRVPIAKGQELMRLLRARLSGLATPTYVLDIPGGRGKVPIGPQWIRAGGTGTHLVTDPQGTEHVYVDRLGADR
jgi:lysine 2,3-aminomutase